MLKRFLLLAIFFSWVFSILSGCAVNDNAVQDKPSVEPINYQMTPNAVDNRVDATQSDARVDTQRAEESGETAAITESTANLSTHDSSTAASTITTPTVERVQDDYRVGTDDLLDIRVFGVDELSQKVRVNSRGYISLPLIGEVQVSGLLPEEVEKKVAEKLAQDYLQDPAVNVFVEEYSSQRVTIGGAVGKPGVYALRGPTTLLQAVAMAGGLGQLALSEVNIFREAANGDKNKMTYDIEQIQEGTIDDPPVQGGDYIIIEKSEARTILRDSLFRDIADFFNPFRFIQ
ncbi:MAG: polysaccharide export protein [Gammaproteobacteria bacterium]|nr:polysaccharide export protein [Gammaproteobacteria bacterium]MCP5424258.1 polysaccharide export protein [Gammaproteobacteria bacterium]MCP5458868.1 polysaccharide export protein [Gammaproteobacteria bacterium]